MNIHNYLSFALFAKDLLAQKILKGEKPLILVWALTNRCNLACTYCGLPFLDHSRELKDDDLMEYLENAISAGVRVISLTGGEPLLHQDIEKFLHKAYQNNVAVSLNSNGLLVEEKLNLIKKYVYEVVISWDGLAQMNDEVRGKGSSLRALNALSILAKAGIRHRANCVFTKYTYDKLDKILLEAKKRNFKVCFQPVWDKTLTQDNHGLGMEKEQLLDAIDFMIEQRLKNNSSLGNSLNSLQYWKDLIIHPQVVKCKAGYLFARIEPSGNIRKCGRVEDEILYEDVLREGITKSFKDLLKFDECTSCSSWASINVNTFL